MSCSLGEKLNIYTVFRVSQSFIVRKNKRKGVFMADIMIVAIIAIALIGIFFKQAKEHRSGKRGCGCSGCGGCLSQENCHRFSTDARQKKEHI